MEKRKRKQKEESSSESEQDSASCDVRQDKKKKKRGRKRKSGNKLTFDESKPWQSSCESSSDKDGEDDDIEFEQYHSEGMNYNKNCLMFINIVYLILII